MQFADMSMSPREAAEMQSPSVGSMSKYPYGLCISLCEDELAKLGLDVDTMELGDFLHLHSLAKVTSISSNETEDGSRERVELVLAFINIDEEEEENKEAEKSLTSKLYR